MNTEIIMGIVVVYWASTFLIGVLIGIGNPCPEKGTIGYYLLRFLELICWPSVGVLIAPIWLFEKIMNIKISRK